jgi:hypothetical protein
MSMSSSAGSGSSSKPHRPLWMIQARHGHTAKCAAAPAQSSAATHGASRAGAEDLQAACAQHAKVSCDLEALRAASDALPGFQAELAALQGVPDTHAELLACLGHMHKLQSEADEVRAAVAWLPTLDSGSAGRAPGPADQSAAAAARRGICACSLGATWAWRSLPRS